MKTIHIPYANNFYIPQPNNMVLVSDLAKIDKAPQKLIKELFEASLKDDPLFHFFYESDCLIIRINNEEVVSEVKNLLVNKKITFEEYDYPHAPAGKYGDDGVVEKYLNLFLPVLHAHAVAALTMTDDEHTIYSERVIHTAFNPKHKTYQEEGTKLKELAEKKLGKKL